MSKVIQVTDENFYNEVAKGKMPLMTEFYAVWCTHCQNMAPIVEELAEECSGKIDIYAADVDKTTKAAETYGIGGIPTFVLFKDANHYEKFSGETSKTYLKQKLEELLKK